MRLQGVGEAIAQRDVPKVLLLNGSHDRETSAGLDHGGLMAASDVVKAVCSALNREHGRAEARLRHSTAVYVSAILVPKGGSIVVDSASLSNLGIRRGTESNKTVWGPVSSKELLFVGS